jgi:aconitate hydratase
MAQTLAHKLLADHLVAGELVPGREIAVHIDQTLTQDATGTLVMLELEALDLDRVRTEVSVQYVDHNIVQTDFRNADDHLFLRSAAQRYGLWFSGPGNGVSHPTHQQRFGRPGATLAGSDSHTCAAGALGMLAVGMGGLEVALAMAGEPLRITMPEIFGVRLTGELAPWVSAKDVVLEMLRRHGVRGAVNAVLEYHGPGLAGLTAMDRHVIANMGAELGATASLFPADEAVRRFLRSEDREDAFTELAADPDATYDRTDEIDLSRLQPLIARPSSPGNVVPVTEVSGEPVYQCVIGSSANPGLRDFAVAAEIVRDRRIAPGLSFDVNPTSREILADLTKGGWLLDLVGAGARVHQPGCLGCIGMGQAPASGRNSLRTMPRNFPGRSGTEEDAVWLCSPETAAASALTGRITDPRELEELFGLRQPRPKLPERASVATDLLEPPLPPAEARRVRLVKGPNIATLPELAPPPETLQARVGIKVGDDVSTDEILPGGTSVLPLRSNIPAIADFVFTALDGDYVERVTKWREEGGHVIVGGQNYGQGSSREHAALAPRYLGLTAVIARSFARIHWQNLANFGVLALEFTDPDDYDRIDVEDALVIEDLPAAVRSGEAITVRNQDKGADFQVRHRLSERQADMVLAGGWIPLLKTRRAGGAGD